MVFLDYFQVLWDLTFCFDSAQQPLFFVTRDCSLRNGQCLVLKVPNGVWKGCFFKYMEVDIFNYLRFEAGGAHGPHPPGPSPSASTPLSNRIVLLCQVCAAGRCGIEGFELLIHF